MVSCLRIIVQMLEVNATLSPVQPTCLATCSTSGSLQGDLVWNSATAVALFMRWHSVSIVQQLVGQLPSIWGDIGSLFIWK